MDGGTQAISGAPILYSANELANGWVLGQDDVQELEYRSAKVEQCGTADEAIELMEDLSAGKQTLGQFDLVILDMGMPLPASKPAGLLHVGETGGYLLERIRVLDSGYLPIILFSQLAEVDVVAPAWEAFESWLQQAKRKMVTAESTAEKKEVLASQFKTYTWLKYAYAPKLFADAIEQLLATPGIHKTIA